MAWALEQESRQPGQGHFLFYKQPVPGSAPDVDKAPPGHLVSSSSKCSTDPMPQTHLPLPTSPVLVLGAPRPSCGSPG